ncbi:MAG: hypothetical protein P8R42_08785 [Candidatus Binatia bacterium]|nr:hypothetical protein [Candidatus Binatia bacterium]
MSTLPSSDGGLVASAMRVIMEKFALTATAIAPSEELSLCRKATALVVGEADAPTPELAVELLAQDAVLLHEVRDCVLLTSVHPPGENQEEEVESCRRHRQAGSPRRRGRATSTSRVLGCRLAEGEVFTE